MNDSFCLRAKSSALMLLAFMMTTSLLPHASEAVCIPNYGLKWVKRDGTSDVYKTTAALQSSPDNNYFNKNLPTRIFIHGGIALLNVEDITEDLQVDHLMTSTFMEEADERNATILLTWNFLDPSNQYNLAFFDWKEFATDHYHRLTAKIWGTDSDNWDDLEDPMRYWCAEEAGFAEVNQPTNDVQSLFYIEYRKMIFLYKDKRNDAEVSIWGNSMGAHIANRFAARWKWYKTHTAARRWSRLPVPTRVILTDPVLHARHLEIQDMKDGIFDTDLSVISKFVEKYRYNTQSPHEISMEIVKTTMPAVIENSDADPLLARNKYNEMVTDTGPGNLFQVFSNQPHPKDESTFNSCVSNREHLDLRWGDSISPEFLDSYCGWKINHALPIYDFFLMELFLSNPGSANYWYDLCVGTSLWDFYDYDYIRYVTPGVPDDSNDGCFEFCNINDADISNPYVNPIECTTYDHQEYFAYSDAIVPGDDPHPHRCGYSDERWMLGMHSEKWENGNCGAVRYPDRYAGGEQNSEILLGTDMGISVYLKNSTIFGGRDVTLFYMGDSWAKNGNQLSNDSLDVWCTDDDFTCYDGAVRNDAIAFTLDSNPDNGIVTGLKTKSTGTSEQPTTFAGMAIPAVHGQNTWDTAYWEDESVEEWRFTTPAGAVAVPYAFGHKDVVVSWYLTAGFPSYDFDPVINDGCTLKTNHCSDPDSGRRPTSWAAYSLDGFSFESVYGDEIEYIPFSKDEFSWSDCTSQQAASYSGENVAKFIGISPMYVSQKDLKYMCHGKHPYDKTSPMCHPDFLADPNGGILAYGAGRPATKSPLYLFYIPIDDLGELLVLGSETVPKAYYFNGAIDDNDPTAAWSRYEADAAPLPQNYWQWNMYMGDNRAPCDTLGDFMSFNNCSSAGVDFPPEKCLIHFCNRVLVDDKWITDCIWSDEDANSDEQNVFGLMSSTIIRNEGNTTWKPEVFEPPVIFLLYNETNEKKLVDVMNGTVEHWERNIRSRTATLSRPWNFSPASEPLMGLDENGNEKPVDGYGPFIIDQYTIFNKVDNKLEVWYVNSSWDPTMGTLNNSFPYGVYTRKNSFDWPPTDLPGF